MSLEGVALFEKGHVTSEEEERVAMLQGGMNLIPEETPEGRREAGQMKDVEVRTSKVPYNEYAENDALFRSTFPHLFLLGKGLPPRHGASKLSTVPHALMRKYLY